VGAAPATGGTAAPVTAPPPAAGGPTAPQLYDQATRDLTEGRYPLALQAYRDLLARFPDVELAPGAQYGVGECFFAQAAFDSAAVEYARVSERWPKGDRTPAALYKLGLCQDRLGRAADSRKTFEDLVRRFPAASEAALARERLGAARR
jgi:tol-pal system protein YbgF